MEKYELLEESYSYHEDMQIIFNENEVISWGEYLARKMRDEDEHDHPQQPDSLEEALNILESANEFFKEYKEELQ